MPREKIFIESEKGVLYLLVAIRALAILPGALGFRLKKSYPQHTECLNTMTTAELDTLARDAQMQPPPLLRTAKQTTALALRTLDQQNNKNIAAGLMSVFDSERARVFVEHLSHFLHHLIDKNVFQERHFDEEVTVVEIGCGTPYAIFPLLSLFKLKYFGMDIDAAKIALLKSIFSDNPHIQFAEVDISDPEAFHAALTVANITTPSVLLSRHPVLIGPSALRWIPAFVPVFGNLGEIARHAHSFQSFFRGPGLAHFNGSTVIVSMYYFYEERVLRRIWRNIFPNTEQIVSDRYFSSTQRRLISGHGADIYIPETYFNAISEFTYSPTTEEPSPIVFFTLLPALAYAIDQHHGIAKMALSFAAMTALFGAEAVLDSDYVMNTLSLAVMTSAIVQMGPIGILPASIVLFFGALFLQFMPAVLGSEVTPHSSVALQRLREDLEYTEIDEFEKFHLQEVTWHTAKMFEYFINQGYFDRFQSYSSITFLEFGCHLSPLPYVFYDMLDMLSARNIHVKFKYLGVDTDAHAIKTMNQLLGHKKIIFFAHIDGSNTTQLTMAMENANMSHVDVVLLRRPVILGLDWLNKTKSGLPFLALSNFAITMLSNFIKFINGRISENEIWIAFGNGWLVALACFLFRSFSQPLVDVMGRQYSAFQQILQGPMTTHYSGATVFVTNYLAHEWLATGRTLRRSYAGEMTRASLPYIAPLNQNSVDAVSYNYLYRYSDEYYTYIADYHRNADSSNFMLDAIVNNPGFGYCMLAFAIYNIQRRSIVSTFAFVIASTQILMFLPIFLEFLVQAPQAALFSLTMLNSVKAKSQGQLPLLLALSLMQLPRVGSEILNLKSPAEVPATAPLPPSTDTLNSSGEHTDYARGPVHSDFIRELSGNENLAAFNALVLYLKRYSSFTLPWNKFSPLTAAERQEVLALEKQCLHLNANVKAQCASRRIQRSSIFSEDLNGLKKNLGFIQSTIKKILKSNRISASLLTFLRDQVTDMWELCHKIAKRNHDLRHIEKRERRLEHHSRQTGNVHTMSVVQYNKGTGQLHQTFVKDKTTITQLQIQKANATLPFSKAQQWWKAALTHDRYSFKFQDLVQTSGPLMVPRPLS